MSVLPFLYSLYGIAIGSFLNVCIYRIPRRESIIFPNSHCPRCGVRIRPYDNVPLLSYLWLRGKCRSCVNPISLRYPLVELMTGIAFYVCAEVWHFSSPTLVNSLFLCIIIALVFIDYDHQILPNVITFPGILAGLILCPFQSDTLFRGDLVSLYFASVLRPDKPDVLLPWIGSFLGALVGGGILHLVATVYLWARKRQGMGMGDVKMMAMVGAFLGWRLAFLTIFAGSLLGSFAGIFLILFRGQNLQAKLAFGTFLGSGAVLSLFFGLSFIRWYSTIL